MLNILSIGIASYNFKMHVASDIPTNGYYLPNNNTDSQNILNKICEWTTKNKMQLNTNKSKVMLFNFTNQFQFTSRILMENDVVEVIRETKLLGVKINDKLDWDSNTQYLVKRANGRMRLLHKLVDFGVPLDDLINIYVLYVRSILEQSCQVWHSSLTLENFQDLERVQKNALKIILQDEYLSYSNALNMTGLDTLFDRRSQLCLKFAQSCLKNDDMRDIFPLNNVPSAMDTRHRESFKVTASRNERHKNSIVPYMQRLLNSASK